jgi:Alpha 1,4-glycosyltransferase conserved region
LPFSDNAPGHCFDVASDHPVHRPVDTGATMMGRVEHRFQSFWHGGALSPYERFCLKSFVDRGHAFDLYTYDPNLAVPAGVRRCEAAELLGQEELFVYQAEGFGKGSPSAFANLFRYRLLAEKGGWWVDTDVVCLADRFAVSGEFFARQDADFVNGAILHFEPRHPVMVQCLERAVRLGRTVKWGDNGPRLLTRVLEERGLLERALPAATCYPIHFSEAVDLLRPSRTPVLAARLGASQFLHLWNAMLEHRGIRKTCLPPTGSLLRRCADQHRVDGWSAEYDEPTLELVLSSSAEHAQAQSRLQAALDLQVAENERLKTQLDAVLSSTSWRLTAPLRAGGRWLAALRFIGRPR